MRGVPSSGSPYSFVKRLLVGRPLATSDLEHQRIPKTIALAVFSSDAISSTAYATEEILFVTAVGASSLTLGLSVLVPIGFAVAALLAIVVTSYRQTIFAYPSGGGSYVVSRENLGENPSLVAGASLLVDYILTVAVSVSAGVAAIVWCRPRHLQNQRVLIGLCAHRAHSANLHGQGVGTDLRGAHLRDIGVFGLLVGYGLFREFVGTPLHQVPFDKTAFEGARAAGGSLGLFVILKGFSSGAVALTGVEAISNGVPAFRRDESKNAAITLTWMGIVLGTLFFGSAVLAHHLRPYPTHHETVISQLGRQVFGTGPLYVVLQFATAAILTLAANTAYADFPRLSSIIAKDGYLPRQFANRGDRLVFSNGVIFLAVAAGVLLWGFGGLNALIPLYAVGVFTSFTLSQAGMVRHHQRHRQRGWRRNIVINATGSVATLLVLAIIVRTKFLEGAWISVLVVGVIMFLFVLIRRHYAHIAAALQISPADVRPEPMNHHTVVVLVNRVDRRMLKAVNYARSLRPNHLVAVFVAQEDSDREAIQQQWDDFRLDVPLEIVHSPYRDLVEPVEEFLDELDARWGDDTVTVVIPEFVLPRGRPGKWLFENVLHNQSALALKLALLYRPHTIVTSVPYHVE